MTEGRAEQKRRGFWRRETEKGKGIREVRPGKQKRRGKETFRSGRRREKSGGTERVVDCRL